MEKLKLKLLGGTSIQWSTIKEELEFSTRKEKALVFFLAMALNQLATRAKLVDLLWERSAEEQARASLRQTLASVRKTLTFDGKCLLETHGEEIRLLANHIEVDALHFEDQEKANDVKILENIIALYQGDFLNGFSINADQFEAWMREMRSRYIEIAIKIMTNLSEYWISSGDLDKSINMSNKILNIDPLNEISYRRLMHLYTLIGRREAAIKQFNKYKQILEKELSIEPQKQTKELYKKIINDEPLLISAKPQSNKVSFLHDSSSDNYLNKTKQDIRYCCSEDGVRLAYAIAGSGSPIIKCGNWMTHIEFDWHTPVWRHMICDITKDHTLVRYDARANGLSEWEVDEIGFNAFVKDLEAVANASGYKKFALLGVSQGCAIAAAYAARYPERVSHLILYGGFASGWMHREKKYVERGKAFLTLIEQGWGQDNPGFRQMFTSMFIPDGTYEQMQWFNELQRISASPKNAARIYTAVGKILLNDLLNEITVPTLVLHCKGDQMVPFNAGSELGQGIPNAKFVPLEGRNHLILKQEPAWEQFISELESFIST